MKRFQEAMNFFYKKHFKVSVFFSAFMKIGIVVFSFLKMFQGKSKPKKVPENYLFISDNEVLKQRLEAKLQKEVRWSSVDSEIAKSSEIILDANYISFKDIISFIEQNKNKSHTFKILPPNSNFIIGSNSSTDRGEVIVLD
jgi:hypothetical protein